MEKSFSYRPPRKNFYLLLLVFGLFISMCLYLYAGRDNSLGLYTAIMLAVVFFFVVPLSLHNTFLGPGIIRVDGNQIQVPQPFQQQLAKIPWAEIDAWAPLRKDMKRGVQFRTLAGGTYNIDAKWFATQQHYQVFLDTIPR